MHLQSDVCIIGNGTICKVTALGFAQAGLSVALLCPAASGPNATPASWDVRVYALNQVAHDLLSAVRVWDALDASRIAPVDSMVVRGDGRLDAGSLGFDAYGARDGALAWIVEDSNLNQALDAALKFAPNVTIISGRAAALRRDADSATVQLENGDTLGSTLLI